MASVARQLLFSAAMRLGASALLSSDGTHLKAGEMPRAMQYA